MSAAARVRNVCIIPRLLTEPAMLRIDFEDEWHVGVVLSANPKAVALALRTAAKEITAHLRKTELAAKATGASHDLP